MSGSRLNEAPDAAFDSRSAVAFSDCTTGIYDPEACWYAVWTRSRQEKEAAATLSALGIRNYLPLTSELRQWSDRKQMVEVPLFSGYLFVCISMLSSKLPVLKVPGIVAFVGNLSGPCPIPHEQIEDIRTVLTSRIEYSVHHFLHKGDRVRVVRGALAGVEGTLERAGSGSRLLISIAMIRQSISVNVLREDVELVRANAVSAAGSNNRQPVQTIGYGM